MSIEEVENEKFRIFLEKFENYESYLDFFVSEKDLNYLGILILYIYLSLSTFNNILKSFNSIVETNCPTKSSSLFSTLLVPLKTQIELGTKHNLRL